MKTTLFPTKFLRVSKFFVLALAITFAGCKKDDEKVAPTRADINQVLENGFFKGTIKGKRTDGTTFEEAYEYKLIDVSEGFEKISDTEHLLSLSRYQGIGEYQNNASMDLIVSNKDQANPSVKMGDFEIEFSKLLADRSLFLIDANPSFIAKDVVLPISRANNETYKLVKFGLNPEYVYDEATGESFYVVKDTEGNKIYFSTQRVYDPTLSDFYSTFKHIINSKGEKSLTSTKFGSLRLYQNEGYEIFRTNTGTDLSETFNIPADTQEITNFKYSASTGLVTFDYKINVNEFRSFEGNYSASNSTMNSLEISGSVSATVHNGTVMRKSAE